MSNDNNDDNWSERMARRTVEIIGGTILACVAMMAIAGTWLLIKGWLF